MGRRALTWCALTLAASGAASAQNLVFNGGFESPNVASEQIRFFPDGTLGGWTSTGGSAGGSGYVVSGFIYNAGALPGPLAYEGNQYLYLNNAGQSFVSLSQTVNLTAGDTYRLSFVQSGISYLNGLVAVSLAGTSFGNFGTSGIANAWIVHAFDFVADSGGLANLSFTSLNGPVTLDDIRLTSLTQVSAVPEPSVYLTMFGGVILLAANARRRRLRLNSGSWSTKRSSLP